MQIQRFAFIVCALALLFPHTLPAAPNYEQDCSELARRDRIPPDELPAYKQWCIAFEKKCYELEERAADQCGLYGSAEAAGVAQTAGAAQGIRQGGPSYQNGTARGTANLDGIAQLRQTQIKNCSEAHQKCLDMHSTFQQSKLPRKPELKCSTFSPESNKWSPTAKRANNLCSGIRAEMERVRADHAVASQHGSELNNIQNHTGENAPQERLNTRHKMDYPDARACGIFGCGQNPDGTYSPRYAPDPGPSAAPAPPQAPPEMNDNRRAPTANTNIRLPRPDARACGIFGCEQNADGTYSPKYAPR